MSISSDTSLVDVKAKARANQARDLVVVRFGFFSFAKVCVLISVHVGVLLALLFILTNEGRRVSFGTYQFLGAQADLMGSLFLIIVITLLFSLVAILSYVPITVILRLTGGVKIRGTSAEENNKGVLPT